MSYGKDAAQLLAAGWHPLPIPSGKKADPPPGFTGGDGRDVTAEDVERWSRKHADSNVGVRLHRGVVGIDVDAYDDRQGAASLTTLEHENGELPPTWMSTSRRLPSAIRYYRAPVDTRFKGSPAPGIDMIQHGHRYALVPGSIHPNGNAYRWLDPAGNVSDRPPHVDELAELPSQWVEALREGAPAGRVTASATERTTTRSSRRSDAVDRSLSATLSELDGGRHDAATKGSLSLVRLDERGHPGATEALGNLQTVFVNKVTGDGSRTPTEAVAEWNRMIDGARSMVTTTTATIPRWEDHPNRNIDELTISSNGHHPEPEPTRDRSRAVDGATFILDEPDDVAPLWGQGDESLWHPGESLLICGPTGVGKTTDAQQLALGRIGLRKEVLGFPVTPGNKRLLYVAADRPRQAARSLRRMVRPEDRATLRERIVVWRGPLPFDIAKEPARLAELAAEYEADTVVIDSLKDVALKLSEDETGSGVNMAVQILLAEGVEVLVLHHQRKGQAGAKPRSIDDVYGSTWFVNGAGSVVLLWGAPGDVVVELTHLKQPVETVGPLKVLHDHGTGTSTVVGAVDPYQLLQGAYKGLSPRFVAARLFDKTDPGRNEIEKARRRLDRLVKAGKATHKPGTSGGAGGGDEALYFPVVLVPGVRP